MLDEAPYCLCIVFPEITPPPILCIYQIQNIFVASRHAELPILSNNRNQLHHSSDFMGISCCGGQSITYCSKSMNTWMIRCKQSHKNRHFSLDLDTKRIECNYHLTGVVSILLGPGLFWLIPSLIPSPILKWYKASSAFHWTCIYKSSFSVVYIICISEQMESFQKKWKCSL